MPATKAVMTAMRCVVHRVGFAIGDLVDADGQVGDVARDVVGAEDFRLAAERAAAQAVHLPQPILRHGNAKAEIQIERGCGIDVRDAGAVTQDLDRLADRAGEVFIGGHWHFPLVRSSRAEPVVPVQPIACAAVGVIS